MQIIYILTKELNLSYNDFNTMNFFEIINIIQIYDEHMKEERKQQEKENKRIEKQMSSMQNQYKFNDMQRQMSNNNNFSMPNFNMPKLN